MSLIERVSPLGAFFVGGRQHLAQDRPTIFLACLGTLRRYTNFGWPAIASTLRDNFPELLSGQCDALLPHHLRRLWNHVKAARPEWLRGMQMGQGEDIATSILCLLEDKAFSCSCLYPPGWTNWERSEVDLFPYLNQLVNARSEAEALIISRA